MVTVGDMVRAQKLLIDHLGIERLLAVAGGSMGGMQALQWAVAYPGDGRSCISIATTHRHSPMQIAFNEVGRQAIMADPNWNGGDYYEGDVAGQRPGRGAHDRAHHVPVRRVHAREVRAPPARARKCWATTSPWTSRWRATCATRARCSPAASTPTPTSTSPRRSTTSISPTGSGVLVETFRDLPDDMRFLVIAFSSDWLYPPYQSKEIVRALKGNGLDCTYLEMNSSYGHDAFLLENKDLQPGRLALHGVHRPPAGGAALPSGVARATPERGALGPPLHRGRGAARARACSTWAAATGTLLKMLVDRKRRARHRHRDRGGEGLRRGQPRALTVYHGDFNEGLSYYPGQQLRLRDPQPDPAGGPGDGRGAAWRRCGWAGYVVASFPNFGNWKARLQLLVTGRAPVTRSLPYQWYDTPNIHSLTIKDFRAFAAGAGDPHRAGTSTWARRGRCASGRTFGRRTGCSCWRSRR